MQCWQELHVKLSIQGWAYTVTASWSSPLALSKMLFQRHTCVYMYMYTYVHTYLCVYLYIYIYTYMPIPPWTTFCFSVCVGGGGGLVGWWVDGWKHENEGWISKHKNRKQAVASMGEDPYIDAQTLICLLFCFVGLSQAFWVLGAETEKIKKTRNRKQT